jgi:hypothetical protein
MWGQVLGILLALAATALSPAFPAALALAVLLGLSWLALNMSYAAALGTAKRSEGGEGRPNRKRLDRHVALQSLLVVGFGLLVGAAGAVDHAIWVTSSPALCVCFGALAVLGFAIYVSGLIDWYYIRPQLDGVVRSPPCRSSREQTWGTVTRRWYRHRAITELVVIFAIVVAVTALLLALLADRDDPSAATIVAFAAPVIACFVVFRDGALQTLREYDFSPPRLWLGDLLTDPASGQISYLLHVTVSGIVVREWNPDDGSWEAPRMVKFAELEATRYRRSDFDRCGECSLINPECEWRFTDREAGVPARRLIF